MGSAYVDCVFTEIEGGNALAVQFSHMCANARYQDGHGGYSGTFAEKYDVTIQHDVRQGAMTREDAEKDCVDRADKWENALAYYIGLRADGARMWYVGARCSL